MHPSSLIATLSAVASVLAIQVTYPQTGDAWTQAGPNALTWDSVATDPTAFRLVLINPDMSVDITLAADVPTNLGRLAVQAPSGGFPLGSLWRANLLNLDGSANPDSILAQSGQFNITAGNTTVSTPLVVPTTMSVVATPLVTPATATDDSSSQALNPTGTSSASGLFKVSGALIAGVALIHALVL